MNPNFTTKQKSFLALWEGPPFRSQIEAAKLAGVREETVSTWRQDAAFVEAMDEARKRGHERLRDLELANLLESVPQARETMLSNLSPAAPPNVRHQAAVWLLEYSLGKAPNRTELTGADGGPVEHTHALDLSGLSDDELDILERIAARSSGSTSGEG